MFALVVLALVVGLAVGAIRGGTLTDLRSIIVSRRWALVTTVVLLIGTRVVPSIGWLCWLAAAVVFALFAAVNPKVPGTGLILAGIAVNAIVIMVNGGRMPVSLEAAHRAGISAADVRSSSAYRLAGSDPVLRPATDVIPLALPVSPAVVGIGDVLIAAGVGHYGAVAPPRARRNLRDRRATRNRERARATARSPDA